MTAINPEGESGGIARATGWLALGNISSRLLGLAREMALANLFGATPLVEALRIAIIIPRTLYDLLIGGNLNGAIVPVFGAVDEHEGRASLWQLVSLLLTLVSVSLALVVLALELLALPIVRLVAPPAANDTSTLIALSLKLLALPIAPHVADETAALATQLLRITAPGLLCFGAFAILSGALLAIRRFSWPAFAVTVFNGTIVVILLAIGLTDQLAASGKIRLVAGAWFLASVLMMALQILGLRRAGWRLSLPRPHPQLRRIARLALPVLLTLLLDVLVTRLFTYRLASQSGAGSINYMELGTTLIQFPQGLVAAAISLAILPTLARHASAQTPGDPQAFTATLNRGLRLATALILPAAMGMFLLAPAIVSLLFEHGAFTAIDASRTTEVLRYYLPGLPFAALDLILVYAFYARQDTRTPAIIGAVSLVFYMAVATLLWGTLGLLALMLADSAKHALHAALSAWLLHRQARALAPAPWLRTALRCLASTLAIVALAAAAFALGQELFGSGKFALAANLALSSGAAGLAYFALMHALGVAEIGDFLAGLRRGR